MTTLYENIKALCDAKGITGGKMCVDIGLSKSLMTGLKNGRKKSIQVETATKIAQYFNVPVDVLTGEGDKKILSENLSYQISLRPFDQPEDIASEIGVTVEQLNAWVSGEEYPGVGELDKIADCFGVMREDIIKPRPAEQEEYYQPAWMDTNTFDAMCKFKCLSPMQQRSIIRQMETYIMGKPSSFPDMD